MNTLYFETFDKAKKLMSNFFKTVQQGRRKHNNGSSKSHYQYSNGNLENYQNTF